MNLTFLAVHWIGHDGHATDVIVHFVPCRIDGELEGYLVVAIDITELKTAQSKLEDLNQALTRESDKASLANEAKSIFLANMSHEIRTPLNALLGISYLLEQTRLDDEQLENVSKIQFAGKSLLAIVNDILDLSKIEAGEMHIETIPFNLRSLIIDIKAMLGNQAEKNGLDFNVEMGITPDLTCIQGDSHKLRQVIVNLLSNAIKFTDQGSVSLLATTSRSDDQKIHLNLSVTDTGIGISDNAIDKLFQPFCQGDVSTTRRFGGTGLGLTISKKIIDMMGGKINVQSKEGVGSTFTIDIDFDPANEDQVTELADTDDYSNLRILLVEDDFLQSQALSKMSSRLGWSVETVHTGKELVRRVIEQHRSNTPYDCLVLDWQLDDLNAFQSLQSISGQIGQSNVPETILISAYDIEQLRKAPQADMVFGFISKPVNASELFNQVSAAVAGKRQLIGTSSYFTEHKIDLTEGQPLLNGLHILLVDDSDLNLEVASKILSLDGAKVTMRRNGQEALDALDVSPDSYDLVLMDIQMPVMDGLTAVQHIRRVQNLSLPVIALTAGALSEERHKALAAGMNDFIAKPFDPKGLVRCVYKHTQFSLSPQVVKPNKKIAVALVERQLHPVFDHEKALERVAGDQAMLASMIQNVLGEYQDFEMSQSSGDSLVAMPSDLARILHKLAGNAGLIGALQVQQVAASVESAIKQDASANLMPLFAELASSLKRFRLASDNYFATSEPISADEQKAVPKLEKQTITELLTMLQSKNIQAYHHYNQHRQAIMDVAGNARFNTIEQAIKQLDFDLAAQELAKLVITEEFAA